jgi:hypothetical protein
LPENHRLQEKRRAICTRPSSDTFILYKAPDLDGDRQGWFGVGEIGEKDQASDMNLSSAAGVITWV